MAVGDSPGAAPAGKDEEAPEAPGSFGSALGGAFDRTCSVLEALSELVEDLSQLLDPGPPACERCSDAPGGACPLALAGLAVPALPLLVWTPAAGALPVVCASIAGALAAKKVALAAVCCMLMGSSAIWHRQHEKSPERRRVCELTSRALLASSAAPLLFCSLSGSGLVPLHLAAAPFVALRHAEELVAGPLWVLGLSYARELRLRDLVQTLSFALLGTGGQIGAAVACTPALQWSLLGLSATCIGVAAYQVSQDPPEALLLALPTETRGRLQRCGNLVALYWLLGLAIQCLGLAHAVDEPQQMLEYALLDIFLKLGGCHLLTKQPRLVPCDTPDSLSPRSSASNASWGTGRSALLG